MAFTIAPFKPGPKLIAPSWNACGTAIGNHVRLFLFHWPTLTMNTIHVSHFDLQAAAKQSMLANGFEPEFPPQVEQQLLQLSAHPLGVSPGGTIRDLRNLLWSSIDNDTSRDLDQIEVAERLPTGELQVLVGIADVDVAYGPTQQPCLTSLEGRIGERVQPFDR